MPYLEWFLIAALAVVSLFALFMMMAYRGQDARIKAMRRTHVRIRELLGPPEQTTDHDNDMLMLIARDVLVNQFVGFQFEAKYYPDKRVVDRLHMIAGYLKPYRHQLKELGWQRVGDFISGEILRTDDKGRTYIVGHGSHQCTTIAILAETAQVLSFYPSASTIEAEIAKDIETMKAQL